MLLKDWLMLTYICRSHFRLNSSICSRMSSVFIRNALNDDRIQISFRFPPNEPDARMYNFDRMKNEELERTLARISANVSKFVNKKTKKKSKSIDRDAILSELDVALLHNTTRVGVHEPNEQAWLEGRCLKIEDYQMLIRVNVPTIKKLTLPDVVIIGCVVRPLLSVEFANETDCLYIWYRKIAVCGASPTETGKSDSSLQSTDGLAENGCIVLNFPKSDSDYEKRSCGEQNNLGSWEEIHRGRTYLPVDADLGCELKLECHPVCGDRVGEVVSVVAKKSVIRGPIGDCPFEKRHLFTKELLSNGCFRFVTYNILADTYADSDFSRDVLFPYCPTFALSMEYRKPLLIKELKGYNADIICLQEVDKKIFEQDLVPNLDDVGFSGLLSLKYGEVAEGTAIFYRGSKFRLLSQHNLPLSIALQEDPLFADIRGKLSKSLAFQEIVFARTSVLQVIVLESSEDVTQQVLVATVHQYFHPKADHVRLLQTITCIRHIERVLAQYSEQSGSRPAVVFCGDLNSDPEAGVHSFVTQKQVSAMQADWYSGGKAELVEGMEFHHTLDLISACGYPRYTNYVAGFCSCLDYIYIESKHLRTLSVVPLPTHEEVTRYTALPSIEIPSDHLALVCDLAFTRDEVSQRPVESQVSS